MSEDFGISKGDTPKKTNWILIVAVVVVIGAIIAGTIAFTRSRDTTPPLTLSDVNTSVGAVKTEVLWVKEKLTNLQADVDDLADTSGTDDVLDVLSTLRDELAVLTGKVDSLDSYVHALNLTTCNCT